jgi:hypothetical protein
MEITSPPIARVRLGDCRRSTAAGAQEQRPLPTCRLVCICSEIPCRCPRGPRCTGRTGCCRSRRHLFPSRRCTGCVDCCFLCTAATTASLPLPGATRAWYSADGLPHYLRSLRCNGSVLYTCSSHPGLNGTVIGWSTRAGRSCRCYRRRGYRTCLFRSSRVHFGSQGQESLARLHIPPIQYMIRQAPVEPYTGCCSDCIPRSCTRLSHRSNTQCPTSQQQLRHESEVRAQAKGAWRVRAPKPSAPHPHPCLTRSAVVVAAAFAIVPADSAETCDTIRIYNRRVCGGGVARGAVVIVLAAGRPQRNHGPAQVLVGVAEPLLARGRVVQAVVVVAAPVVLEPGRTSLNQTISLTEFRMAWGTNEIT